MQDVYMLRGRIDSGNADEVEKELCNAFSQELPKELTLDASELTYISSAGLRVLLRLKKQNCHIRMIHISSDVYEILEMTGFTKIIETHKALREISIEGCPEIGRGAHGIVYRIAPDTIVKVFYPGEPKEEIERERELARWAFIRGIPTAIPYDVVRVGEQYGTVFELLNARSAADYVKESPENLEDFVGRSVRLMKQIHSIEVEPGELPDMKQQMLEWLEAIRAGSKTGSVLSEETCDRLETMIRETPDSRTLLHADLHLKNIMICGDEFMLIDMDTICAGDPVFDLATICNSYWEFPSIDPAAAAFLGIDVETAYKIFDRTMEHYLCGTDPAKRIETIRRAKIFGCVRIIDYIIRHQELPAREQIIEKCRQDIEELMKEAL